MAAVELHMVSDATGETAQRLVQALEAQFPDQEFLEIRHPRVESIADMRRKYASFRGGRAPGVIFAVCPDTFAIASIG